MQGATTANAVGIQRRSTAAARDGSSHIGRAYFEGGALMPLYAYKGVDAKGKAINGTRDADSPKGLRALMRRDGIVVTDVAEARGGKAPTVGAGQGLSRRVDVGAMLQRIKPAEVAAFTRQLATLLHAGIPLAEALGALYEQLENPKFKTMVGEVRTKVNEGSSLADALGKFPRVFEGVYVSMVRAGETAGNLDAVLMRLAEFTEAEVALRTKVTGAMMYPAIMGFVASVVMVILMVAVVPKITDMYKDSEKALPWNTELLIWSSNLIAHRWYLFITGFPALIAAFVRWKNSPAGRPIYDRTILKLPIFGPLSRQISIGRFTRTFGTMLTAGVPLLRALDVSKDVLGNSVLIKAIERAREDIQQGDSIAGSLRKSGHFPSVVLHMIAVGERAGQLETMLTNVADAYEAEVEMKLNRMTTLLEPIMIVGMGGAVAFIVFSILIPILDMNPT
jgi:general secretion pathway protein F